jgi:hypothetical protein
VSKTGGRLEFHLVGVRNRNEAVIEVILNVLGADHFVEWHFLLALVAPVTLTRVPWHCECTGVLNVNPDVQRLAAIDQLEDIMPISFAYRFLSARSQPEDIKHERVALLVEFRSVDPPALR